MFIGLALSPCNTILGKGGGVVYEPEALALFARFTTPPTTQRKGLINNAIKSLKTAGVWSKLDGLYVLAAADAQAARQNWIADTYNLTAVSSPSFTTDRGYQGDGSSSYLDSNFNPIAAVSPKFTQDSGSMGIWSRTDLANGAATSFDIGSPGNAYLGRDITASGRAAGRPLQASGATIGNGAFPGHAAWSRTAAAVWEGYAQGVDSGGGTTASAASANGNVRLLSANNVFGTNQLAAAHIGSGLSAGEMSSLFNILRTYLQAVGAAS